MKDQKSSPAAEPTEQNEIKPKKTKKTIKILAWAKVYKSASEIYYVLSELCHCYILFYQISISILILQSSCEGFGQFISV